jgi:hypothetical protein
VEGVEEVSVVVEVVEVVDGGLEIIEGGSLVLNKSSLYSIGTTFLGSRRMLSRFPCKT